MCCCEVCSVSLLDVWRKPKAISSESHPSVAVIRRDHRWTGGRLVGLITTWLEDLRDRKPSETGQCWGKHFWVNLNEKKKKWQVLFQPEPIPSLSWQFNVAIAQNNSISGEPIMTPMNQSHNENVLLSVPTIIINNPGVRFDRDLQEKICVLNTYQHGTCSLYSRGFIEQQLKGISDFIQDSFTVSSHSEYMGKEAPRIRAPIGIYCKGVLSDLWPELQQTENTSEILKGALPFGKNL